ncbi:MAG: hypothetical protein FWG53_02925 [Clostridiales bacterium]|nr:hypothetical protein [Clostridiales bacterium]
MMDAVTSLAQTILSNKGKYALILEPDIPECAEIAEIAELGSVEVISYGCGTGSLLSSSTERLGLIICAAADGSATAAAAAAVAAAADSTAAAHLGMLHGYKNQQHQNFWVAYQKPEGAGKELYDFLQAEYVHIEAWEVFFDELLRNMQGMPGTPLYK